VSDQIRFRLDDLRRFATELISGVGLAPPRAVALAAHLLWFDAAGAPAFGIGTLSRWLGRIQAHEFDVAADGNVMSERNGLALVDGRNGLPPLVLERAAVLASEKAREAGIGLVRVSPLGPTGPATGVAAELAIGPYLAAIVGPGPGWTLALPSAEGLPAVFDSALAPDHAARPRVESVPSWSTLAGWVEALAPSGGWLVGVIGVPAWEPLSSFHERIREALGDPHRPQPGLLRPEVLTRRRHEVHRQGVGLSTPVWSDLAHWAERLGITPLNPLEQATH
jgi:hypothetical protein